MGHTRGYSSFCLESRCTVVELSIGMRLAALANGLWLPATQRPYRVHMEAKIGLQLGDRPTFSRPNCGTKHLPCGACIYVALCVPTRYWVSSFRDSVFNTFASHAIYKSM